jgi:S-adenosylmethionine uptake transporter
MNRQPHPDASLLPFAVAALGIALFSVMDAVMKGLSLAIGAYNAVLWRMIAGLAITAVLYVSAGSPRPSRPALNFHLIRGFVASFMAVAFFWGLARMPLAEAIALAFVAPIFALFLAALLLGETIGSAAIIASALGFGGVLLIVWGQEGPDGGRDLLGVAAVLGSAVLYAYNIVLMRQQALVAKPVEITFFQHLVVVVVLAAVAPFFATLPSLGHLPAVISSAVLGICSLMLLAWAYARAQAQHLAPVEYSALVWAALLGYFFFDEALRLTTLFGATLIVGGCLVAARAARPRIAQPTQVEPL